MRQVEVVMLSQSTGDSPLYPHHISNALNEFYEKHPDAKIIATHHKDGWPWFVMEYEAEDVLDSNFDHSFEAPVVAPDTTKDPENTTKEPEMVVPDTTKNPFLEAQKPKDMVDSIAKIFRGKIVSDKPIDEIAEEGWNKT